jgi:2-alkenal reductase
MEQLIGRGAVSYAYIGIVTTDLTPAFARHFNYSVQHGAVVTNVVGDSPAKSAGLRSGKPEQDYLGTEFSPGADVIVAIDGRPVRGSEDVVRIVTERLSPGQLAHFTVVRGKSRLDVPIRLGRRSAKP